MVAPAVRREAVANLEQVFEVTQRRAYNVRAVDRTMVRYRSRRGDDAGIRELGTRAPMAIPQGRNQRWSLDFVSDAFACGRRFRIFAVVDDFTRECVRLTVDTSISGLRVARELDWVIAERSRPAMVVSDNGTELTSMAILCWSKERDVE